MTATPQHISTLHHTATLVLPISSNDNNVIKRLCAYINYWCTEDGINAYSDSVLYRQGSQMGTNGAQLGILLDEDEGSNRVVQFTGMRLFLQQFVKTMAITTV